MPSSKKIKLPAEAEMLRRLKSAISNEHWEKKLLAPLAERYGGAEMTAEEIVAMFRRASSEYVKNAPPEEFRAEHFMAQWPKTFVTVLLAEHDDVREEALRLLR